VKSSVEALEGNKVKVVVEVGEAEFEKDLDAAFKRLARDVRLPGFRPGKAPRKVLEARIGQGYARTEAFREALPVYYTEAVKEHEVDVIAPPEIDITDGEESGAVAFDAVVEVRPSITVTGYETLEIEVPTPTIDDADIDEAVDRLRGQHKELETVDRAVEAGDSVVIDIEVTHEDEALPGLTTDDYVYEVGSGAVVPDLDENLIGSSAGDHLDFEADHPEEEEEEPLVFTIDVKEVQAAALPEPTDEWVSENSEFNTLDELRNDFRTRLGANRVQQARNARQSKVAEALAELVDDDQVPAAMIDGEVENRAQDMALRLQQQGLDLATFLELTGQSQEGLATELRESAVTSAKLDLALRAIAEVEDLAIAEDDLDDELAKAAEQLDRTVEDLRADFAGAGRLPALRADLLKSKALDWVVERANLVDEDGQPVSPDALELPDQDDPGEDDQ
jgi:trigger factor